ncbi:MAG TPA: nuclear transport factor 2 family protein [Gaiellaceae bacterium]|jgi:hypothetical protein|nr:nuclear transport factor 2 family protein [Gaiellaceae bacterium]
MDDGGGQDLYERQVRYLEEKRTDEMVDHHYADDATFVTFGNVVRGREALKEMFRGYLESVGFLKVLSTDKFAETSDTILFEATVNSSLGQSRVYDAFVLREGKILYHFAGVIDDEAPADTS